VEPASALAIALALAGGPWAECRVTATPVAFGTYDVFASSPLDAIGEVVVSCSAASSARGPRIWLDAGANPGRGFGTRRMRSARGASLAYDLFRDAARTEVWGDGTRGTQVVVGLGRHVVHGRVPALQAVPTGQYSDTVTVTVEW
jgi:spore coat protein U-like protein